MKAERANPFLPEPALIVKAWFENPLIKTFQVVFEDEKRMREFDFIPGQVGQLSAFGAGEATFVINSPPTRKEYLQFSVMRAGEATKRLHSLRAGDRIGLRAPLGGGFDVEGLKGKDVVLIAGGIGMAPLRTLLLYMLDKRVDYGNIMLIYGSKSPEDFCFKEDLADWAARADMRLVETVDNTCDFWDKCVGLVPNVLLEQNPSPKNCVAVTCGPPIMIHFTLKALEKLGFGDDQVVTTLERRMKCGVGLCGRCNIGEKYVCVDGPVFTLAQLKELPAEL
jgi:NAD(P)H-flavin reductase